MIAMLASACGARASELPSVAWPPRRDPHVAVAAPAPMAQSPATEPPPTAVATAPIDAPPVAPAPRDHYEERAPGVHVREGESDGIGFLDVVLGDVDPESELPLVIVIHGRGDRPRVPGGPFAGLTRAVRVVMPRAELAAGEGFSWLPVRAADGQTDVLAAALGDVSARLARLIEHVRAVRPTRGPTIVTGFSQGGMLTITLAIRHPALVGVAFPLAGWLPPPLWPSGAPPANAPAIRTMHARDDDRIAYAPTLESYEHLRAAGWDLELATFDGVGHAMSVDMDALFHGWLERALEAIERGDTALVEPPVRVAEPVPALAATSDAAVVEEEPVRARRAGLRRARQARRPRPTEDPSSAPPRQRPRRPRR